MAVARQALTIVLTVAAGLAIVSVPLPPWALRWIVLAHVLAAFAFVAGYVGTNAMTEVARRTDSPAVRRSALDLSGWFDRRLNQTGGSAVLVTGVLSLLAFGYAITTPWVVASAVLFLTVPGLGGLYWAPLSRRIDAALAAGDDEEAARILRARRTIAISRLENSAVIIVIALMVLRPS